MAVQGDKERFATLDHIRGLSILGILIVNALAFAQPFDVYMNAPASPVPLTPADDMAWWAIETFAREKFITLFSMLFGVSLFLVGETNPPGETVWRTPLFRRLGWLVVFGLVHGAVIWLGDVLLLYAVTGFVFWQWRGRSGPWLLTSGIALYLINFTVVPLFGYLAGDLPPGPPGHPPDLSHMVTLVRSGFVGSLQGNFVQWKNLILLEVAVFLAQTLSLMMIGLGLFKTGFLKGRSPVGVYGLLMAAGLICLTAQGVANGAFVRNGYAATGFYFAYDVVSSGLPPLISLGYASALILVGRVAIGRWLLYPLQCAGRMAFTNYLTQSLIMTALFYGGRLPDFIHPERWGLPWYGEMNSASLVPIVAWIWAGQLVVSMLWLQVFRYGPFEWGWRCLTYRRWVGILK